MRQAQRVMRGDAIIEVNGERSHSVGLYVLMARSARDWEGQLSGSCVECRSGGRALHAPTSPVLALSEVWAMEGVVKRMFRGASLGDLEKIHGPGLDALCSHMAGAETPQHRFSTPVCVELVHVRPNRKYEPQDRHENAAPVSDLDGSERVLHRLVRNVIDAHCVFARGSGLFLATHRVVGSLLMILCRQSPSWPRPPRFWAPS